LTFEKIFSIFFLLQVFEGEKAVEAARKIIGETDPVNSNPGTIRGDFGLTIGRYVGIPKCQNIESSKKILELSKVK
jgi:nucleoside-diphosphate kinase